MSSSFTKVEVSLFTSPHNYGARIHICSRRYAKVVSAVTILTPNRSALMLMLWGLEKIRTAVVGLDFYSPVPEVPASVYQ
jgi:hypothetical protein